MAAKAAKPELVFMDLGMPRMNGYDAARLIRNYHMVKPIDFTAVEKLL